MIDGSKLHLNGFVNKQCTLEVCDNNCPYWGTDNTTPGAVRENNFKDL